METPAHEYFAYFGYIDMSLPVEQQSIEFPISIAEAQTRTGLRNPNLIIAAPPQGWIVVYRSYSPSVTDTQKVVEVQPVFNDEVGKWVQAYEITPMTTEEITDLIATTRRAKELEINTSREAANNGYFIHKGKRFASDQLSMKDISVTGDVIRAKNALPVPWVGAWKTKDNTFLPLASVAEWDDFVFSIYLQGINNFQHSEALKQRITQATNLDMIKAISWNTETGFNHS